MRVFVYFCTVSVEIGGLWEQHFCSQVILGVEKVFHGFPMEIPNRSCS
jgi:hypothetical protein